MDIGAVLDQLRKVRLVAVLRAPSPEAALKCVDALVEGGVTGIEVTYSTPDAAKVIAEVSQRYGDRVLLGAGTVTSAEQARESVQAGATFLVAPGDPGGLAEQLLATGVVTMVGALTPSEVMRAAANGSHVVKLFPGSLGGPAYLRALRSPFPEVELMPTGGVNASNVAEWFAAGAIAVGAGGELCPVAAMKAGDWFDITERAKAFVAALP